MANLFKRYKIALLVLSCGLILLGFSTMDPGGVVLFTIPGAMLGTGTYLVNAKNNNSSKSGGDADELIKWNQLRESGVISDEEFEEKKKEVLG